MHIRELSDQRIVMKHIIGSIVSHKLCHIFSTRELPKLLLQRQPHVGNNLLPGKGRLRVMFIHNVKE
ncbi:hypothetical protein D3C72_2122300 [compost metagenome]